MVVGLVYRDEPIDLYWPEQSFLKVLPCETRAVSPEELFHGVGDRVVITAFILLTALKITRHSNRYIDLSSSHPFTAKISLGLDLFKKATKIIASEENWLEEKYNITNILRFNNFPKNIIENRLKQNCPSVNNNPNERSRIGTMVLPYHQGRAEELKWILKPYKIRQLTL
ncbi:unnamed protein product [Schistosoma margrebowiei]|uniref:Helix-turn-helix domain-containing protein n=1 Tax=Schistosoma margrebowiei TaxID=48269 RepID=A0A183LYR7_9TREM|nr:unnamed protein product [Schistosoma margrebowiei]